MQFRCPIEACCIGYVSVNDKCSYTDDASIQTYGAVRSASSLMELFETPVLGLHLVDRDINSAASTVYYHVPRACIRYAYNLNNVFNKDQKQQIYVIVG